VKTGRRLHAVEFAPGYANHPIAPEPILEKIRLGAANEILLFSVIRCVRLNDEALREIASTGTKNTAVPIEIDLVRHVVESPDAVALPAGEPGFWTFQTCGIGYGRVRPCCEMNFETANRITVALDVFAPLAVTGFARDPELGDL
jgi:hypothetical protein